MISEASAFVNFLPAAAIRRLPGIDDMPWGIEDRDILQTHAHPTAGRRHDGLPPRSDTDTPAPDNPAAD